MKRYLISYKLGLFDDGYFTTTNNNFAEALKEFKKVNEGATIIFVFSEEVNNIL